MYFFALPSLFSKLITSVGEETVVFFLLLITRDFVVSV